MSTDTDRAESDTTASERSDLENLAFDTLERGEALLSGGHPAEALEVLEEALHLCGDCPTEPLQVVAVRALLRKVQLCERRNALAEAVLVFEEIDRRFHAVQAPVLRWPVAGGMRRRALLLEQLSRFDDAAGVLTGMIARYREDPDQAIRHECSRALINLGDLAGGQGRTEEALEHYTAAQVLVGPHQERAGLEIIAQALLARQDMLRLLGRDDEALETMALLLEQHVMHVPERLRPLIAEVIHQRGALLLKQGRSEEAIAAWRQAVRLLEASPSELLGECLCQVLLALADHLLELRRPEAAVPVYRRLVETPLKGEAGALPRMRFIAHFKLALLLEVLQRYDQALEAEEAFIEQYQDVPEYSPLVATVMSNAAFRHFCRARQLERAGDHAGVPECLAAADIRAHGALERAPGDVQAQCLLAYLASLRQEPFVGTLVARAIAAGGPEATTVLKKISALDAPFQSRFLSAAAA